MRHRWVVFTAVVGFTIIGLYLPLLGWDYRRWVLNLPSLGFGFLYSLLLASTGVLGFLTFLVESDRDRPTSLARGKGYPMGLKSMAGNELGSWGGFASYKAFHYPRQARRRHLCRHCYLLSFFYLSLSSLLLSLYYMLPLLSFPLLSSLPLLLYPSAPSCRRRYTRCCLRSSRCCHCCCGTGIFCRLMIMSLIVVGRTKLVVGAVWV